MIDSKKISKFVVAFFLVAIFSIVFGPAVYASFIRTQSPYSGFSYGYGYGYGGSNEYGYGYGYGTIEGLNYSGYGFEGEDGAATIDPILATKTTIDLEYTTLYTAIINTVEWGLTTSYGASSAFMDQEAGTYIITASGLDCGESYYFRITSEDAGGNLWYGTTTSDTEACSSNGGSSGSRVNSIYKGIPSSNPNICPNGNTIMSNCTVAPSKFIFTKNLPYLIIDSDVLELQKFLNNNGFPLGEVGPGSKGNETTKFGAKTKAALIKFQKANNIWPSIGFFREKTRAFINNL